MGKVLAFARDIRLGILPTNVEFKAKRQTMQDVATPTIAELDSDLATTGLGTPILPVGTAASDAVAVANITITPLALVHLLSRSPFFTPINAWNLIAASAVSLGLDGRVMPLLHWLQDQTSAHAEAVDAFSSIDLANATLQAWQ